MKTNLKEIFAKTIRFGMRQTLSHSRNLINENLELTYEHRKYTFGDQKGQVDFLINNIFNYSKNGLPFSGYFVDLACADGVEINNTYFLEKYLGWTGLLFEPNPIYFDSIRENRTSKLVEKCVTDVRGSKIVFRIDDGMSGGIVSDYADNNYGNRSEALQSAQLMEMETTTLEYELDAVSAPSVIDFMSLDIEGAEWIALRNFCFDKYIFRCMVIERPSRDLDILLAKEGYRQVAHLSYDVFYVHQNYLNEVNFNPQLFFSFTPRKDF